MSNKVSIRFYNDRKVRAVWSEADSKWYFSATDIVRAINDEPDYIKAGNYWRWLKRKLAGDGVQLVSGTHDFKFEAPDGKMRKADVLDAEEVETLAKHYPNNRANNFLDVDITEEEFGQRIANYQDTLTKQFEESHKLETEILSH